MGKKVAVVQSNYIPWKGYFDLIKRVDEFILFDDMQYTRRDWRNRNRIKTPNGPMWLTIPVENKGKYTQKIRDTIVNEPHWYSAHWQSIVHSYAKAPYFREYRSFFEQLYTGATQPYLSQINYHFLSAICQLLGIRTRITWSMDYRLIEGKTERLVDLCKQAHASEYLSGATAKEYLEEELFSAADITLSYMDYAGYREYRQCFPPFEHAVSIIDLIFNVGPDASQYMQSV